MTALVQIKRVLKSRADLAITCVHENPRHSGEAEQLIRINVAPVEGIYDLDKLQILLNNLFSEVPNGLVRNFEMYLNVVFVGFVEFRENVGRLVLREEILDEPLVSLSGEYLPDNQDPPEKKIYEKNSEIVRIIRIVLYPDQQIANDYILQGIIPQEVLEKNKSLLSGFFKKIGFYK